MLLWKLEGRDTKSIENKVAEKMLHHRRWGIFSFKVITGEKKMERGMGLEVLAPAGSVESMKAAVAAGADAVYMGGSRFGARAYADNPDEDGMLRAIDYIHLHGRRLYLTVNTLFREEEMGELYDYLLPYYKEGLDAVIVQDLGVMAFIRRHFPGLDIHASTQMTITGVYGARLMKELGAVRVVTARELSLEEISRIHQQVDVEIESFVHGALCYCYSGQCLMSSLIGGRSGNRGRCAQPCRLPYEARERGKKVPANPEQERYLLSLKDLCTLDLIPQMAQAGVYSMKIEGRMKSPRYTAGVVRTYRKYVDRYLEHGSQGYRVEPEDKRQLAELFDRGGFTEGYYRQHNGRDMVALKEKPAFRKADQELFDELDRLYVNREVKEPVRGKVRLEEGSPAELSLSADVRGSHGCVRRITVQVQGQCPGSAKNQPLTKEKVQKQIEKTGSTPFEFERLETELSGSLFLPVQALNELRRSGLEQLQEAVLMESRRGEPEGNRKEKEREREKTEGQTSETSGIPELWTFLEEPVQLPAVLQDPGVSGVYLDAGGFPADSWKKAVQECRENGKQCYLALPHIFRTEGEAFFKEHQEELRKAGFQGFLVRNLEELQWLKERDESLARLPRVLDGTVYCWNRETVSLLKDLGAARLTLPWELNSRQARPVSGQAERVQLPVEIPVYGRIPMMVSAQCIRKTTLGCSGKNGQMELKDRTGARMAVKNRCAFCYNTIYNSAPLSLLGNESGVAKLDPAVLRLNFTTETGEETAQIIRAFRESFLEGKKSRVPFQDFTRGHFKRGVE